MPAAGLRPMLALAPVSCLPSSRLSWPIPATVTESRVPGLGKNRALPCPPNVKVLLRFTTGSHIHRWGAQMQEPALACSVKLTTPQGLSFWTQLLGTAPGPRSREERSRCKHSGAWEPGLHGPTCPGQMLGSMPWTSWPLLSRWLWSHDVSGTNKNENEGETSRKRGRKFGAGEGP